MAKLHEALAVESTLKGQADKTRAELANTFEKRRHLFSEKVVTFKPSDEGQPPVTEEQLDLNSTVPQELAWIKALWAKALDASFQIAEANMSARADVVLDDGKTLLKDVPATALLELEKRAAEVHALVASIPTLDPAKGFTPDPARGAGVYKAREESKTRTKKVQRPVVLYDATKEHPAQVQLVSEDVPVGLVQTQEWSGLLTPAAKSEMLERAEALKRALKQARARANEQDIDASRKPGLTVLGFVFGA